MSRKLAIFKKGKYVHMVAFVGPSPLGGDVEKIGDFGEGKYMHIVAFFGITSWGRCL